jgi:hypothetical protein
MTAFPMLMPFHDSVAHAQETDSYVKAEALIRKMKSKDPKTKLAGMEGLANMGCSAEPALIRLLKTGKGPDRIAAAALLGGTKSPKAMEALAQGLRVMDQNAQERIGLTLSRIGPPAIPALQKLLKDPKWQVRCLAVAVIADMKSDQTIPVLVRAADDPDWHVRLPAVMKLGTFNDQRALDAVERRQLDANDAVQTAAKIAIANINYVRGQR